MGTTTRFGLHYQALSDAPDGAGLGELLAEDTDSWLARVWPVADAAGRSALSVSEGFLVRQRDDGSVWVYTDIGTWSQLNGASGGGGGGGGVVGAAVGEWSATSTQSFPSGSSTVTALALGNEDRALAGVTRSTKSAGHKFTCTAGTYLVACTVRLADDGGAGGSKFIALRKADDSAQYWSSQDSSSGGTTTRNFSGPVVLASTTDLYVGVSQSTGSSLSSSPTSSISPSGFVKLSLTRIG